MTDHNQKMIDTINNYVITNRLAQLEKNTAKKAIKVLSTRAQQMLLLQQMGFFESTKFKNITSTKKKAKLLSYILNASADNIEGDLTAMNLKSSYLKTVKNYELLIKTFQEAGLKDMEKAANKELDNILKAAENKKTLK
jgi:ABC-type phosphate transport system ATPase subunit